MNQNALVIQPFAQDPAKTVLNSLQQHGAKNNWTREHGANRAIITVDSSPVEKVCRGLTTQQHANLFYLLSQHEDACPWNWLPC